MGLIGAVDPSWPVYGLLARFLAEDRGRGSRAGSPEHDTVSSDLLCRVEERLAEYAESKREYAE